MINDDFINKGLRYSDNIVRGLSGIADAGYIRREERPHILALALAAAIAHEPDAKGRAEIIASIIEDLPSLVETADRRLREKTARCASVRKRLN